MRSGYKESAPVIATLVCAATIIGGCSGPVRPEVTAGLDACAECNMVIDQVNQACGHAVDGEFVAFDSPGCLLRNHDELRRRGLEIPTEVWLADYDSAVFVPAVQAALLFTDQIPTVMGAGVLSFATIQGAEAAQTSDNEMITDWTGYRRLRGQADTLVEAIVSTTSLTPEMVEVAKGELVLFRLSAGELDEAITLEIRGYPEIGEIVVTPSEDPTELRFYATRPGAGFPIFGVDDQPLGMMRVTGAHTDDEAAQ